MAMDAEMVELRKLPLAIDRSWDRTPMQWFAARGVTGVLGYLSWDPTKNWTKALVAECHAAGMWVGLNWEGTGGWDEYSTGAVAGRRAGQAAKNQADALGAPASVPIFCSIDTDIQTWQHPTIGQWLDAFAATSGHPVGVYGEQELVDAMLDQGHATVGWQTNAYGWDPERQISAQAALVQIPGDAGLGVQVDENRVRDAAAFAWFPDGRTPSAAPSAPSSPQEDDDMPSISLQPGQSGGLVIPAAYRKPRLRVSMNSAAKTHGAKARVVIFGPDNKPRPSAAHAPKDPWHVWIPNGSRVLDELADGDLSIDIALDKRAGGSLAVLVEDA